MSTNQTLLPPTPTRPPTLHHELTPPTPDNATGWWELAFPRTRNASEIAGHARGACHMLTIVCYDIADPKRLTKVASCCLDFGIRVQYSVFECRLDADTFDRLWTRLTTLINPDEDRLVAYPIHGADQRKIRTLGTMQCSERVIAYIF